MIDTLKEKGGMPQHTSFRLLYLQNLLISVRIHRLR